MLGSWFFTLFNMVKNIGELFFDWIAFFNFMVNLIYITISTIRHKSILKLHFDSQISQHF